MCFQNLSGGPNGKLTIKQRAGLLIRNVIFPTLAFVVFVLGTMARSLYWISCCLGVRAHYSERMASEGDGVDPDDLKDVVPPEVELNLATLAAANTAACRESLPLHYRMSLDWDRCKAFWGVVLLNTN